MANKQVEFHQAASLEYEATLEWYLERNEVAASKFADELNRAIAKITEAPQRWPAGKQGTRKFFLAISICDRLSRTSSYNSDSGCCPWSSTPRVLEKAVITSSGT